jgi:hypothetical protein
MASKTVNPPVPESNTPIGKFLLAVMAVCAFKFAVNANKRDKAINFNFIRLNYLANVIIFLEPTVS